MLLDHGELGLDPARLADVRGLGQAVRGADQVGTQPQPFPAGLAVGPGTLGLQPVEERQAELLGPGDVRLGLLRRDARPDQRAQPVIVLRPVHQGRPVAARVRPPAGSCGGR